MQKITLLHRGNFYCAFDGLEKLIQTRTDKSTLGFGSQLRTNLDSEETLSLIHI